MIRRIAPLSLVSVAIATFSSIAVPTISSAATQPLQPERLQSSSNQLSPPEQKQLSSSGEFDVAQLFYPPVNEDQQALMVIGQGEVSAAADTAQVEFSFTNYDPYAVPDEGLLLFNDASADNASAGESPSLQAQAAPGGTPTLTSESLQPIVDALVASGISADLIEVTVTPGTPNVYPYTTDSGVVSFDLSDPSSDQINQAVEAVNGAIADSENLFLQNLTVQYLTDDCQTLEQDAYLAAVDDARSRATALATAMGVEIAQVPSIAESPFNFLLPACGSADGASFYNPFAYTTSYFDPEAPAEVQVRRDIFVTFPIR